ncbi:MAG: carbohydrate ABC transporter permease [Saccharofermentanales bacterium]
MKNRFFTWVEKTNYRTVRLSKKVFVDFSTNFITYAMLIALTGIFLAPFIYMLGGSLMSAKDLADINVKWIPTQIITDNYRYAFMVLDYWQRLGFSFLISGGAVLGQVVSCALVGYGLARVKFKLRGIVFGLVIFSLIVPPQTIIVSQYLMYSNWNLAQSWWPIILPCFFSLGLNGGLFVFLFRQYFRGMPKELENAAMIDGLGIFGTFFKIMFRNAASMLLVTSILAVIWQWNNFFEPSIYIKATDKFTLTMMLRSSVYFDTYYMSISYTNGLKLAATVLAAAPIIIVFFILQRRFIKGIERAGLAN